MKKIFLLASILAYGSVTVIAQHDHSSHGSQTITAPANTSSGASVAACSQQQLSQLLSSYFNIKNALVTGDAISAASNADQFLRSVNAIDYKTLSKENLQALSTDAGRISGTKNLKRQREYFANFSSNLTTVANSFKLAKQPVYVQYCPMQKASWLSSEKEIRNPYYGSSMLTCGEVAEIINPYSKPAS